MKLPKDSLMPCPEKICRPKQKRADVLLVQDDGTIMVGHRKTLRRRAANMYRLKNMLCKRKEQ